MWTPKVGGWRRCAPCFVTLVVGRRVSSPWRIRASTPGHLSETQWEKPAELQAQETAAAAAATAASSAAAASEDGTAAKDGAAAGTAESSAAQPEAEVAAAPVIGGWTRVEAAPVATEADAEKQARLKVRLAGTDDNGPCPCLCRKR